MPGTLKIRKHARRFLASRDVSRKKSKCASFWCDLRNTWRHVGRPSKRRVCPRPQGHANNKNIACSASSNRNSFNGGVSCHHLVLCDLTPLVVSGMEVRWYRRLPRWCLSRRDFMLLRVNLGNAVTNGAKVPSFSSCSELIALF